eukprot:CAMPEP_0201498956 /NCGR_PEP_ID=MMETSP0151_2-20130828/73801_1 /ASSEMBLY_ACC=CAM_ASM_000257 /TAXON_ID=200890 /ORGANISM="Paramoeba atlantica, Strain 621/1 / CCAP 1560/9" /LENGTH=95 /DNA_ID=CAMNT_0047890911 /DNA_START=133 /DNA_END=420 /DNA_ORIENTATION=-
MPSTLNVMINKEDHTLANLLRMRLNDDNSVAFSAYKVQHPIEHKVLLKVQTIVRDTEKSGGPKEALLQAADCAIAELTTFLSLFETEFSRFSVLR